MVSLVWWKVSPLDFIAGFLGAFVITTLFMLLLLMRRFFLLKDGISTSYDNEEFLRRTPVLFGRGILRQVGWLGLTKKSFYFVPVGFIREARQKTWSLADIMKFEMGDEINLPDGSIIMPVDVLHPSGRLKWILPEANRWYTTLTIQINPQQRQRQMTPIGRKMKKLQHSSTHTFTTKDKHQ